MLSIAAGATVAGAALVGAYVGLVTGAIAPDLGVGRRVRRLGPQVVAIDAPRDVVFDVIASTYLGKQPRAVAEKVRVLERGTDMVLAAHRTPVRGRLVATTVETVRFTRPERIDFRLVRGPVPHVVERFELIPASKGGTTLEYRGELGTDLWWAGERWGDLVAAKWEHTVAGSLDSIKTEADRLAARKRRTG
jgi:hypothetical protein